MPHASKTGRGRQTRLYTKVSHLKELLQDHGENRAVDEREITSKQVIEDCRSFAELSALLARKPRSVLWLGESTYLYKRSYRGPALDLLEINSDFVGLKITLRAVDGQEHLVELHWGATTRPKRETISSVDQLFRLFARDDGLSEIRMVAVKSENVRFLPVSPVSLRYFMQNTASTRTVSVCGVAFTKEQAPMLLTNKDGRVELQYLDLSLLGDGGISLLRGLRQNEGPRQLHLKGLDVVSTSFLSSFMHALSESRLVHTLSIVGCDLRGRVVMKNLADMFRVNRSIETFSCEGCHFITEGWSSLWSAIKTNSTLTSVNLAGTGRRLGSDRDHPIQDALLTNTTLQKLTFDSDEHKRVGNFPAQIEPRLERNRLRKVARDISKEPCQVKRWRLLGHALRHPKVRNDPALVFTFLKTNVDNFASYALTGKEVVLRHLTMLEDQHAVLLARLQEYSSPPSREVKRKRDYDDGIGDGGHRRALRTFQETRDETELEAAGGGAISLFTRLFRRTPRR
jgi:hypothetical protein